MPKKAHFIGIGGVGMSAVAKLLRDSGVEVSGSDEEVYPPISDFLKRENLPYKTPYAAANVPADADLVVIGKSAKLVPETNSEVAEVIHRGLKISSFPEVLADLTQGKKSIVVAGSYGKSSSAALLSHCLERALLDPSYFIGAVPKTPASSARIGKGEYFVLEGDEYPSSNTDPRSKFLHYAPTHLLVTPLAHDHFNVFPTPADYLKPFNELLALARGTAVVCTEGPLSAEFVVSAARPLVTYGLTNGEYQAATIVWGEKTAFDITRNGQTIVRVETRELGEHSVQNIVGVAALVFSCNILTPEQFKDAVASFAGIVRRLDRKSDKTSVAIFEGFGSSYEKAKSAVAAMKRHFPARRLLVVFEPYTINWRKQEALHQYADVFAGAHRAFILEPPLHGKGMEITVEDMAAQAKSGLPGKGGVDTVAARDPQKLLELLANGLQQDDAVLLLSSGPLGGLVEAIPRMAEQKFPQ
jgi:UDP-N-acetylmuramate: L-alanyl-gamma-D-glutamyl-meso-diaminopimelate ligase